jgi:hypothetical protein
MQLDAVRFEGPGTDLTIGLLPQAHWTAARLKDPTGRVFQANLPTEEVFTTPDHRRVNGVVRSTRPLALDGNIIRDLELTFTDGVATKVRASTGADIVRTHQATDPGAARLGPPARPRGRGGREHLHSPRRFHGGRSGRHGHRHHPRRWPGRTALRRRVADLSQYSGNAAWPGHFGASAALRPSSGASRHPM